MLVGWTAVLWATSAQGQTEIGTYYPADIETPRNYAPARTSGQHELAWSYTLQHLGATYISLHFADFDLAPGDYLRVSDTRGLQEYTMSGKGKMQAGTFWARHVKGDAVVMDLFVSSETGGSGFVIDQYAAGDMDMTMGVYPPDDRENAICYEESHPVEYDRSRAVVRLLINGRGFCTGSLVSAHNIIMTNEHCVNTAEEALNTDYEFMAEAPECSSLNCPNCWPGVLYSGGTLMDSEYFLDYSLVLLSEGDAASEYGYLEFDNRQAVVGEQIYFPQHSAGRAKEIAIYSSWDSDNGGVARVQTVTLPPCRDGASHLEVGYYADSEGGSSGSPILATSSHKIIALNHCHGTMNMGVGVNLFYPQIGKHIVGLTLPGRIAPTAAAISADSSQPGSYPDQAIDRELSTGWISSSGSVHWLEVDLGANTPVYGFKVWHASAGGGAKSQNSRQFTIESAPGPTGSWMMEFVGDNPEQDDVSVFEYGALRVLRHVRVVVSDPGSDGIARIREFEVMSQPPMTNHVPTGPNLALSAVHAEVSSQYSAAYGASKAIDGIISEVSKWTSADVRESHTLTIDLGSYKPVTGFILRQPIAAGEPSHFNATRFEFQTARSMSGPWFTQAQVLTSGENAYEARRFISPKDLRYVRLQIDDPGIDRIARVPEFEIIGAGGPFASFEAFNRKGAVPLTVDFTDLSAGEIASWLWSFGDGGTSNASQATHIYTTLGLHAVSLTVAGPGGSDSITRQAFIEVTPSAADFDLDADVDMEDFGHLQACLTGPGIEQTDDTCSDAKLDADSDVDQDDFDLFRQCLNGADTPPAETCGI
jgi:hypothetical protein